TALVEDGSTQAGAAAAAAGTAAAIASPSQAACQRQVLHRQVTAAGDVEKTERRRSGSTAPGNRDTAIAAEAEQAELLVNQERRRAKRVVSDTCKRNGLPGEARRKTNRLAADGGRDDRA